MIRYFVFSFLIAFVLSESAVAQKFTRKDSLKGSITAERVWWDLLHYKLEVEPDIPNEFLTGANTIRYKVLQANQSMQIDLQKPMVLEKIEQDGEVLEYTQEGDAYFVKLIAEQALGEIKEIKVFFKGRPRVSLDPPWDGGFIWSKDAQNKDFVANAVQHLGPSSWFPCKDHPYDEPDQGADMVFRIPADLEAVGNGRLIEEKVDTANKKNLHWRVTQPINGYGINMSIGDYKHFGETYQGEKGELTCDYYVLSYNLEKAKSQFKQVPMMLEAFEHWFGPYPFYEDGYKLVEVPYLGMEHQSCVTYGNGYKNGYLGGDLSFTGWGKKFDFIIIHESGHEWFANSITYSDVADMWIHEGFTNYSEVLYLDYHFGTEAGNEYLIGMRELIKNDFPVVGSYDVSNEGSSDMYVKGASLIHMIRQLINDDEAFRQILRGMNQEFFHKTVSSKEIEAYFIQETGLDLQRVFDQYLRTTKIPRLHYKIEGQILSYRYGNTVEEFNMPLRIYIDDQERWINPTDQWQDVELDDQMTKLRVDENFYVNASK